MPIISKCILGRVSGERFGSRKNAKIFVCISLTLSRNLHFFVKINEAKEPKTNRNFATNIYAKRFSFFAGNPNLGNILQLILNFYSPNDLFIYQQIILCTVYMCLDPVQYNNLNHSNTIPRISNGSAKTGLTSLYSLSRNSKPNHIQFSRVFTQKSEQIK